MALKGGIGVNKFPTVAQMIELNKFYDSKAVLLVDNRILCLSNENAVEMYGNRTVKHLDVSLVRNWDDKGRKVILSLEVE